MAKIKKKIHDILKDLKEEEFKDFKWNLEDYSSPEGSNPIPPSDLEKADRRETVNMMVRYYDTDSVQVAMKVLEEMQMNHLAHKLSKMSSTGKTVGQREPESIPQETPRVQPAGVQSMRRDLMKYSCELTIDTNTVQEDLKLSDNNRKVTCEEEEESESEEEEKEEKEEEEEEEEQEEEEDQSYPDHPDRFDPWPQLLCKTGLTGRHYWEVEWSGDVEVSVSYSGIRRKGDSDDCRFGYNDQSWSLKCFDGGYSVRHNNTKTRIPSSSSSGRVAVYVDRRAGSVSFYEVSSDTLIHLHTFSTTFTKPLYPGFGFWPDSSVYLRPL